MRVLLFETTAYYPSSPLFLEALQVLTTDQPQQVQYTFVDEARFERAPRSIATRIGCRLLRRPPVDCSALNRSLLEEARSFHPEMLLICKGAFIAPATLATIKRETGAILVNYATDDPLNQRVNTRELVDAIPLYDLYACTKRAIMADVVRAGCENVIYLPFAYKPSVHFPDPPQTREEHQRFDSDVVFIGGCDCDRAPFMKALVRALPGLNLALYGGKWSRSPSLRRYWRGFAVGRDFRMALGGSKIAINLVRRANRDGHVMRSFEIPACRTFMLAERTDEHLSLFRDRLEASYFKTPEDLIDQVRYYLANPQERAAIAAAGYGCVVSRGHTYSDRLRDLLNAARSIRQGRLTQSESVHLAR